MKHARKYAVMGVAAVLLCGGSYFWGRMSTSEQWAAHTRDALTMQRLLWIRTDIDNLSQLRDGKAEELVRGMETVVDSGLASLDVAQARATPLSASELEKTKAVLARYIAKFPTSQLEPKGNKNSAAMLK